MRAKFIVKYEMNRQEPYHSLFQLRSNNYHQVPDRIYNIQYDNNRVVIDFGQSREWGHLIVTGRTDQYVSDTGLLTNKPVLLRYCTDEFAGGRFIIYVDHTAELTTYGSGVPIVNSLVGVIQDE